HSPCQTSLNTAREATGVEHMRWIVRLLQMAHQRQVCAVHAPAIDALEDTERCAIDHQRAVGLTERLPHGVDCGGNRLAVELTPEAEHYAGRRSCDQCGRSAECAASLFENLDGAIDFARQGGGAHY